MAQRAGMRQQVDKPQVDMVVPRGTRQRRQGFQPADGEQAPPARRAAHDHFQRQPARHRHVPPGLERNPGEGPRQCFRPHLPQCKELLQVTEGQHGVKFLDSTCRADAGVNDREGITVQTPQESSLRHARRGHRGQVRDQLGIVGGDRGDNYRISRADQRPPVGIFPEPEVCLGHQLIANNAAGNQPETGLIAGVDQLFRRGGVEVRHRLRRQDQRTIATLGDRQREVHRPGRRDGIVRAGRQAFPTTDAILLDDLHHARLGRQRDGIGRADPDARQTGDAARVVDVEVQRDPVEKGWA
jgi:hypothetical protein